ncbi:MAG: septum formation initiator family protein [Planctomycetes bacterium]|nr:septum formation initiator family protein [Planctomycetota bacterium]
MQQVEGSSGSAGRRALSSLAFWALALVAMALFGLSVVARPMAERRAALDRQAIEQAKTDQLQQLVGDLTVLQQALADDPEYVARRARQDLGYHKSGEQRLPFKAETAGVQLKPIEPAVQPMTRLERICRRFEKPVTRSAAMVVSIMTLAVAMLVFDIPTRPRGAKA